MANRKISDLTALTAPAAGDLLPIVDISEAAAADKNKKITIEKLFQGIPSNVGIATSSPNEKLEVAGGIRASGALLAGRANSIGIDYATNARIVSYGADTSTQGGFVFLGANSNASTSLERLRIDSSGRLLVGTSSAGGTELIQVQGTSGGSNLPGGISLRRSSLGNGDDIGYVNFTNASGNIHASIKAFADGTPGAGDYPGALVFSTTADGASSPTERARIDSSGRLLVGGSSDGGGALLQVFGDRIRIGTAKTPASASATGTAGEICWDASYIYVCTATNTWKRTAIATW